MDSTNKRLMIVYMVTIALIGLATGLSESTFSNYFKDAYHVDAFQRGIIEIPRETPGVMVFLIISALSFIGDLRLAICAKVLSAIGMIALGLMTPPFAIMLVFLFIHSLGQHMMLPLSDSIGMSLAKEGSVGSSLGRLNGTRTAFNMIAGIIVFIGFRTGFFSFTAPIKINFLIAAGLSLVIVCLLFYMLRLYDNRKARQKTKLLYRKEYNMYYLLAILFGARKQIMMVYGPWVLIELLDFKADTMALLAIAGSAVGMFFIPAVGRWIDRHGTARIMIIEATAFFFVYIAYGMLSAGLSSGFLAAAGLPVVIAFVIKMADAMTTQFGMVRAVYMRSIAFSPDEVTQTLSLGMALDHVLSIAGSILCGWIWTQMGPLYVFVFAAFLAVCNMLVALNINRTQNKTKAA